MGSSAPADLWIVNHYANTPGRPTGTRHHDLARQLAAHGHEVLIFAAGFSNVTHREERLTRSQLCRTQRIDGIRFVWLRTVPYGGNSWWRYANMLSFVAVFLVVQSRFAAPKHVIGSTVHPFAALGAWAAARLRGARFLFEIRDLWPQTLVDLGALREGSVGERLLRAIEALLVRQAACVISLLPGMVDYLRERGLPTAHVAYIPNGVDLAAVDRGPVDTHQAPSDVRKTLDAVERYRMSGRCVFGYVGAFGRVNGLDSVIEAASIAEAAAPGRVGLVLVGDGVERPALERLAASGPVVVVGPVPKRWVPLVVRTFDAAVVHATATPVYRYGISFNKLFDYLAAARPVLFACGSAYDPVASVGAGISLAPDDPRALADAMLAFAATDCAARERMGQAGREYAAEEHDIARLGTALARLLEEDPR